MLVRAPDLPRYFSRSATTRKDAHYQLGALSLGVVVVSLSWLDPSDRIRQMSYPVPFGLPLAKTILLPSRDQDGARSDCDRVVNRVTVAGLATGRL